MEMKAQGDVCSGRILLGDNTGGGAVIQRPNRSDFTYEFLVYTSTQLATLILISERCNVRLEP